MWAKGKFDVNVVLMSKMKLEDFFFKCMNPRQKRYEAMHVDNFKQEIA